MKEKKGEEEGRRRRAEKGRIHLPTTQKVSFKSSFNSVYTRFRGALNLLNTEKEINRLAVEAFLLELIAHPSSWLWKKQQFTPNEVPASDAINLRDLRS